MQHRRPTAVGKLTFDIWMERADRRVAETAGLSVYDLTDMCYRDMFLDGTSPKEAAQRALENDGFFGVGMSVMEETKEK